MGFGGQSVGRLLHLSGVEVVGVLPDSVADLIDLPVGARTVRLHPGAVSHIVKSRGARDADFVFGHLHAAIHQPQMIGREARDVRKLRLVHRVEGATRWLHVSLKFVAAIDSKSGIDELWVSTAYPMGRSIRLIRNKPTFWHVVGLAEDWSQLRAESAPPGVSLQEDRDTDAGLARPAG